MKQDVLVSVSGLQYEIDAKEAVEVISTGKYHKIDEKHYISYEETIASDEEDEGGVTKNLLKISPNLVELCKKGYSNVTMVFETGKKTMTYYNTPFGKLLIGIHTTSIHVEEKEEGLIVIIRYSLDMNYEHISDCAITIKVIDRV